MPDKAATRQATETETETPKVSYQGSWPELGEQRADAKEEQERRVPWAAGRGRVRRGQQAERAEKKKEGTAGERGMLDETQVKSRAYLSCPA